MTTLLMWITLLGAAAVALYTLHYARWAFRHGYRRGGVGLLLLAALTAAMPIWQMLLAR